MAARKLTAQEREAQRKIDAELRYQAALHDIGRMALAYVAADVEAYRAWHLKKYGTEPKL